MGYRNDGRRCLNIDECTMGIDNCLVYSKCEDTDGSFQCVCEPGFKMRAGVCVNMDECLEGLHGCHSCSDTWGSFKCSCDKGYLGNGTYCSGMLLG